MKRFGLSIVIALVSCVFSLQSAEEIAFEITGGADQDKFEIVNGDELKLKDGVAADFEAAEQLEVEITARTGVSETTQALVIKVSDVAEVKGLELDNDTIPENVTGATVGRLSAILGTENTEPKPAEPSPQEAASGISFFGEVHPILKARCIECHGPDKQKGDLRLDQRDQVLGGAVIAGKPEESELYKRISLPPDDIDIMPSEGEPLSKEEIELIRQWIAGGASWPSDEEQVDFASQIQPIFEASCYECHGPSEQKGDLRLDDPAVALEHAIVPGNPEESELVTRIKLPADHDDIMPAEGDPLSEEQVALIEEWILNGANWPGAGESDKVVYQEQIDPVLAKLEPSEIELLRRWIDEGAEWPQEAYLSLAGKALPIQLQEMPVSEEEKQAIATLKEQGILVMPVAQDSDWVRVNFSLVNDEVTNEDLAPVANIPHLIELNLGRTAVTDEGLKQIQGHPNLTRLDLNNTAVTDQGLAYLSGLNNLMYLNLYGTGVTDEGLKHLTGLKTLQKVFLWQTGVTDAGAKALDEALPGVQINRGVQVASQPDQAAAASESESEDEAGSDEADQESDGPALSIAQVLLGTFSQ